MISTRRTGRFASLFLVFSLSCVTLTAIGGELEKPIYTEITLRSGRPSHLSGHLLRYDDTTLVVRTGKIEKSLKWVDLTGTSAFILRSRLIDKSKAEDWLELGTFGWDMGVTDRARESLAKAARMNPALDDQVKQVLVRQPGSLLKAADAPTSAPANAAEDDSKDSPAGVAVAYVKSTPEQDKAAIEAAEAQAKKVATELGLKLSEIQTAHFLIFTDWDPREYEFLKTNLEGAYGAVSRQFNLPVTDNIFVGKLPVYMIAKQEDFAAFATRIDHIGDMAGYAGYYWGRSDGVGHMVMWKPDLKRYGNNVRLAERSWAYVLTHEFTHAFVARYRSNARIPNWLNEGIAEVIASTQFPRPDAYAAAIGMAKSNQSIAELFTMTRMDGKWYPVMRTLAETLIARDHKAFMAMFDDLKAGMSIEDALQKHYHWTLPMLEAAWRQYLQQVGPRRGRN